ncbi:MAG: peptidase M23 [Parcubacteria group bacterium Gr01-1014_49]|nr:MAG: peptidase M23 [Parcubacteria group bacterium Gr01-1014_49]
MRRFFLFLFAGSCIAFPSFAFAQNLTSAVANRQQELKSQLEIIEGQIAAQEQLLNVAQNQRQTLQTQVDAFNAEIKRTQLQIQAITLTIAQLNDNIGAHNETLSRLSARLAAEKESLAQILRQTQMLDAYSAVSVALGSQNVSDFFSDLDAFASIKSSLAKSFTQIEQTSASTEAEKEELQARLAEQEQLRTVAQLAKQSVQAQEREKQKLLVQTKGIEANYQKIIAASQKTAAQIRSELFLLRDSASIPFGVALSYAQAAERATGTRAAVTLAVLKQETNLGENLGTGTWRVDMSPTRDRPIFSYITQALGLDPDKMPVSKKPWYGWGGAMGPGQFIPSTWVCFGGFIHTTTNSCSNRGSLTWEQFYQGPWTYVASKDRVRKLLGSSQPSNPWNAQVAIMATAMLMADNGASKQTPAAERLAALRYFAGWAGANKPAYAFYGDGVMGFAANFQRDINLLSS